MSASFGGSHLNNLYDVVERQSKFVKIVQPSFLAYFNLNFNFFFFFYIYFLQKSAIHCCFQVKKNVMQTVPDMTPTENLTRC